jgi:zinc protease
MKRWTIFAYLFTGLVGGTTQAIPTIQNWETTNGAQVYFVPAPEIPMVDVEITFDAGSARDADHPGVATLTNGLLNEGAGKLTADQIAEQLDNLGARLGLSVDRDSASVSLRSLSDPKPLQTALDLLTILLTRPNFEPEPLERVRAQILASLKYQEQSPDSIADNAFYKAVFGKHPYALPTEGTKESVTALKREEVKAFHARYYVAKNAVVAIVGAIDRPAAEKLANTVVGTLPPGEVAPPLPPVAELSEAKTIHIDHPATQTSILLGQLGMAWNDPERFIFVVGNYILGGSGFASFLLEEVREKRGLAYSAYSYFSPQRVTGPFIAGLQTRNDQTAEALKIVHEVIRDFLDKGPGEEKLKLAKQGITGGFPLRIKSNGNILSYLSTIGFYHLPLDYLHNYNKNIEAVTLDKIKESFNRRLHLDKWVTVTVGGDSQKTK